MVESIADRRLKVIVDKCNEAKMIIEQTLKDAEEFDKLLMSDKIPSHLQRIIAYQRRFGGFLKSFERVQGKVEFVMDSVILLQQMQSKEGKSE